MTLEMARAGSLGVLQPMSAAAKFSKHTFGTQNGVVAVSTFIVSRPKRTCMVWNTPLRASKTPAVDLSAIVVSGLRSKYALEFGRVTRREAGSWRKQAWSHLIRFSI